MKKKPVIGDTIYIPSSASFDMIDGVQGGKGTINEIDTYHLGAPFIKVEEVPDFAWNYNILIEQQSSLKKLFGDEAVSLSPSRIKDKHQSIREDLNHTLRYLNDVSDNMRSLDIFNEGDNQAIKAMKLGLERLKKKLPRKR